LRSDLLIAGARAMIFRMSHQAELWAIIAGLFASTTGAFAAIFLGLWATRRARKHDDIPPGLKRSV
jgi:hypothetical protein